MGRYSPTVVADYGPGIGAGLERAAQNFVAMRDRKRTNQRQDEQDSMTKQRFARDLEQQQLNEEAQRQGMKLTDLQIARAEDDARVAPILRESELRGRGYVKDG